VDVLKNKHFLATGGIQTTVLGLPTLNLVLKERAMKDFDVRVSSDYCHSE